MGSFVGVIFFRIPKNISFWSGRSKCDNCGRQIYWYDNIPLLSHIVLWGKCRSCRKKIDIIYPLTELATGILFVMIYIFKDKLATNLVWTGALGGLQIWYFLFLGTVLLTLFLIDLKHQLLPDGLIYSALLVSILLMILTNFSSLYLYLLTGFGGALFFLMFKAVLFDLDNTLIDFTTMKNESCKAAVSAMVGGGLPLDRKKAFDELFALYGLHGIEDPKIFQKSLRAKPWANCVRSRHRILLPVLLKSTIIPASRTRKGRSEIFAPNKKTGEGEVNNRLVHLYREVSSDQQKYRRSWLRVRVYLTNKLGLPKQTLPPANLSMAVKLRFSSLVSASP